MQCAIDNELVEVTGFSLRERFLGSYFERKQKKISSSFQTNRDLNKPLHSAHATARAHNTYLSMTWYWIKT